MASPQVENGYVRVANELLEALIRQKLTDSEWRVLLAIVRLSYGYNTCRAPMSLTRLENETGLYRPRVVQALRKLEGRNMITIDRGKHVNVIGPQKDHEKWGRKGGPTNTLLRPQNSTLQRTTQNAQNSTLQRTKNSTLQRTHKRQKTYIPVFEHWNSKGIIKHRTLTEKMRRAINGRLREGYGLEDITKAIDNYAAVLGGDEYFFSYRWTLNDFLTRGLERFVDEARPLENFRKDRTEACRNAGAPYPRSAMARSTLEACGCKLCRKELERSSHG